MGEGSSLLLTHVSVKSETFGNIVIFEVEPHGASETVYLGFYLSDLMRGFLFVGINS